ncbi:MAG: acylphosphatase [Proteobacteria bacterium]|jgi:acylphosphatase|nr:acylphosphatase [Pseudomonadota bacterium]
MPSIRFSVTGRVQGVGFRMFTRRQADALGLVGWVRNVSDGSVEGCAEGSCDAIDALVETLHQGPVAAKVTEVTIEDTQTTRFENFRIVR